METAQKKAGYRFYRIGADGHVVDFIEAECAHDGEAIRQGDAHRADHDVEVRLGHRVVAYLLKHRDAAARSQAGHAPELRSFQAPRD